MQEQAPRYTQQLIRAYNPGRSLRSASIIVMVLYLLFHASTMQQEREIIFKNATTPMELSSREPQGFGDKAQFKSNLKTHLFSEQFIVTSFGVVLALG